MVLVSLTKSEQRPRIDKGAPSSHGANVDHSTLTDNKLVDTPVGKPYDRLYGRLGDV